MYEITFIQDPVIRAFLLTNLDTNSKPLKFRVPLNVIDDAIPDLGDFPYEPRSRKWEGETLFVKGAKSKLRLISSFVLTSTWFSLV